MLVRLAPPTGAIKPREKEERMFSDYSITLSPFLGSGLLEESANPEQGSARVQRQSLKWVSEEGEPDRLCKMAD